VVVLVAATVSSPALAQGRLSLAERVARLEAQAQGQGQGQTTIDLLNRIDALQNEVTQLRGLVEQQGFEIENLKKAQRDRYVDLDSRLARLEGGAPQASLPAAPAPGTAQPLPETPLAPGQLAAEPVASPAPVEPSAMVESPVAPAVPGGTSEKAAYDDAFAALRDGRYADSARRFAAFLEQYPDGEFADNAIYWLGESYYVTQNYRIALDTFRDLLTRFPESSKAPDALLKVGYCHYELREWADAEAALSDVVRRYPDTTVARLAQGRLRALRLEGQR
jgi:tol-pal system protein YbgF